MAKSIHSGCFSASLGASGTALAADDVNVKVAVIHAVKGKSSKDQALKKIESSLRKAFGGFSSFKQLDKHGLSSKRPKKRCPMASAAVRYDKKEASFH